MKYQLFLPEWEPDEYVEVGFIAVVVGDFAWVNRPLFNISFIDEKSVQEIISPVSGLIREILINSGDVAISGQLAMILETE